MTNQYIIALAPDADRWTGNPTTDRVRCPGAGKLQFLVTEGVGGVGTITPTCHAHIANSGGTPEAIPYRYKLALTPGELDDSGGWTQADDAGDLMTAGASKQILIEVRADELPAGKPFVSVTLTETDSTAVDAAVIAIVKGGDHPGSGNSSL
jgi:hypothetical protein